MITMSADYCACLAFDFQQVTVASFKTTPWHIFLFVGTQQQPAPGKSNRMMSHKLFSVDNAWHFMVLHEICTGRLESLQKLCTLQFCIVFVSEFHFNMLGITGIWVKLSEFYSILKCLVHGTEVLVLSLCTIIVAGSKLSTEIILLMDKCEDNYGSSFGSTFGTAFGTTFEPSVCMLTPQMC